MAALPSKSWWLLGILLAAVAFFLAAYFWFYRDGGYSPPPTVAIPFERIAPPSSSFSTFSEVPPLRRGTLLVDGAHSNGFSKGEIGALLSRVADRGYDVKFMGEANSSGRFGFFPGGLRVSMLSEKLREADSYAVILPEDPFGEQEADLVERFVQKGGKLLLISDPTRESQMNSLAERFGVSFRPDYLFNTREYDINFQNVFIRNFQPDQVTQGLGQVVMYTAGSIASKGPGLAYADGNTRSSMSESAQPLYPMVKEAEGRVLALADLTFMIPPQNSIVDNDKLVSNVADYLTESEREFELADFPHFFTDEVDILLGRSSLLELGTQIKGILSTFQIDGEMRGVEDLTRDAVFVGLYDDSAQVAPYLEVAGIQVGEVLRTSFTPDIAARETALMLMHRAQDRHVLLLLGTSEQALCGLIQRLQFDDFRDGLVGDTLAVYGGS